jgi:hypothetical protein
MDSRAEIEHILDRCRERGVERTTQGAEFICRTPKRGPEAFLHCIYKPCTSDQFEAVRGQFGFDLPADYVSFLKRCNGASFFGGAISLYGHVKMLNRGLRLEDRQAIDLDHEHLSYRLSYSQDWDLGWRPVGSLVAQKRHRLTMSPQATFRLQCANFQVREWDSFFKMLLDCLRAADDFFDCDGYIGEDYSLIEASFLSLAALKH